jgi:hypothetical protein
LADLSVVQAENTIAGAALALLLPMGCGDSSICGAGSEERDGTCVPICVQACGAHQECVATDTQAACKCVAGYEGEPCTWKGVFEDPGFGSQEAWPDSTNGAAILPLSAGPTGLGIASFVSSVVCNAGAVSQVVEMPSYELAEPLAIELTYRAMETTGVAIGYNRAFRRMEDTGGAWATRRVCLGEAGYGGPVKFQVAASSRTPECFSSPTGEIEVDRIQILVAAPGECPAPGSVLNGQADQGQGGWFFEEDEFAPSSLGRTEGGLEALVGKSGSSGARIYKEAGGSNLIAMGTKVSVPTNETLPSPALRFWWKATASQDFRAELGTFERDFVTSHWDTLVGDGDEHTYTYCLPPWTHGNVVDLAFYEERTDNYLAAEGTLVVDEVELISDTNCGVSQNLLDPSFDSAPNRWPHVQLARSAADSVQLLRDQGLAHPPGDGVLALTYQNEASLVQVEAQLWVPQSEGAKGPMAVFYSNVPSSTQATVRWLLGTSGIVNSELLPGGGWRKTEVCLPPEWAERWFRLSVHVFVQPGLILDAPERVLLDDFALTTDEKCPAL